MNWGAGRRGPLARTTGWVTILRLCRLGWGKSVKEVAVETEFWAELERRDVVFRSDIDIKSKMPFAIGSAQYEPEIGAILTKLQNGAIGITEAIKAGTEVMERYYGVGYALK